MNIMWVLITMCAGSALIGVCQAVRNERELRRRREREELQRVYRQYWP